MAGVVMWPRNGSVIGAVGDEGVLACGGAGGVASGRGSRARRNCRVMRRGDLECLFRH